MLLLLLSFTVVLSIDAGRSIARAEPVGTIEGIVRHAVTKEPLAGVNVLLIGTRQGAVSAADGSYRIASVPPGTYALRFFLIGFVTAVRSDVVVRSGAPTRVDRDLLLDVIVLPEVELTFRPQAFQERLQATVSTTNLSREEIRRFPGGFEDVVRTVTALPGVAAVNEGGRNDLLVRGGGPTENLYRVNGLVVPNINHFSTQGSSSGSLSFVNLDFVDRVEFSSGGFGARYGDRLSSFLDLELRPGRRDRWGGKATLSASQFGLNLEGPAGRLGSVLASARRSYLDLIFKAAGQPFVPVYSDYNLLAESAPSPRDRFAVLGLVAVDRVERDRQTSEDRRANAGIMGNAQDQYVAGGSWRHLLEQGYCELAVGRNQTDFLFSQGDTAAIPVEFFRSDARETEWTGRFEVVRRVAQSLDLTGGLSVARPRTVNRTRFAEVIYDRSGRAVPRDSLGLPARLRADLVSRRLGAWAQAERELGTAWRFSAGLRADDDDALRRSATVSPRLSIVHHQGRRSERLALGRYRQSPSSVWLLNPANRDLRPLRNDMAVLGLEWLWGDAAAITVETYYKRLADLPAGISAATDSTAATDYLVLTNAGVGYGGREDDFQSFGYLDLASRGTGEAFGIEFLAQKKLSTIPCYGQASLSIGRSGVRALNGRWYPGQFDQRVLFSLSGGYVLSPRWEFSTRFRIATGAPYTPVYDPSRNPVRPGSVVNLPEEYLSRRLRTNHQLDARVDRRWNFEGWSMIAFLDVQNLYNYRGEVRPNWNFADAKIERTNGIGILPSLGLSAEF